MSNAQSIENTFPCFSEVRGGWHAVFKLVGRRKKHKLSKAETHISGWHKRNKTFETEGRRPALATPIPRSRAFAGQTRNTTIFKEAPSTAARFFSQLKSSSQMTARDCLPHHCIWEGMTRLKFIAGTSTIYKLAQEQGHLCFVLENRHEKWE